jgi:uncharacterized protein (DUF427 family)
VPPLILRLVTWQRMSFSDPLVCSGISEFPGDCPYKGDCAYFSIPAGGERSINAVWSYEEPSAAVAAIKGHLAFYPDRVDAIEEHAAG